MELKEAIKKLNKEREINCQDCEVKHYDMAIKALRKQIPLEVKYDEEGYKSICPSCGVGDISDDYFCWKCGQRLDWS